jgi:hypothetical protein
MLVPATPGLAAAADQLKGSLKAAAGPVHVVGLPVLLELEITNTGDKAFAYWKVRGNYPDANDFVATVQDERGGRQEVRLSNDNVTSGGALYARSVKIEPGQSVRFPAAMAPLPAGTYRVTVRGAAETYTINGKEVPQWPATETTEAVEIEVAADADRAAKFERDLLARARAGERFAQHVAAEYAVAAVIEGMTEDLAADVPEAAVEAVKVLRGLREMPAGLGGKVRTAVDKQLARKKPDKSLLAYLAYLAEKIGDDDALEAVLAIVRRGPAGEVRLTAVQALGPQFKQEKASKALWDYAGNVDNVVGRAAVNNLAHRRDPDLIPVLVRLMSDRDVERRKFAFGHLTRYGGDRGVFEALEAARRDTDPSIREVAEREWRRRKEIRDKRPATD